MSDDSTQRPKARLLFALPPVTIVSGLIGWHQLDSTLTPWEITYRAFAMVALNWDVPYQESIPWLLEVSRFSALLFAYSAAVAIFWRVLRAQRQLWRAKRAKHHVVLMGNGPEIAPLAIAFRKQADDRPAVVVVGHRSPEVAVDLQAAGVILLPAVTNAQLSRILVDAEDVIVAGNNDSESARLATRVASYGGETYPNKVLFSKPQITRQWNHNGRLVALCRPTQVAIATLRETPPRLDDAVCPPPIVVGDSSQASEIVRRIVTGWQQIGESMIVHCVGENRTWVDAARVGLEHRFSPHFVRASFDPDAVVKAARELQESWTAFQPDRFTVKGPSIIVGLSDSTVGFPIAARLAESMPDARVTVLVEDPGIWHGCLSAIQRKKTELRILSASEQLTDPAVLQLTPAQLLAEELLLDASRWRDDVPPVFGKVKRPKEGRIALASQDQDVHDAILAVAHAAIEILKAGNIGIHGVPSDDSTEILSNPEELKAMQAAILAALPASDDRQHHQRALELATRLPTLAARAGWAPYRLQTGTNMLTPDEFDFLARRVHEEYKAVSAATSNATQSPNAYKSWDELAPFEQESNRAQVADFPAKLVTADLTWIRRKHPVIWEFKPAVLEELAKLEHRRWEHHQHRNGRGDHDWALAWEDPKLGEKQKEHDRSAIRAIPVILAQVGIEITPISRQVTSVDGSSLG